MFYSNKILKKEGKFGIIWLAATAPKRIKKKDTYKVDVSRTSNDVIKVLTQHQSVDGKGFSLYLSSQLMYGLTYVHNIKSSIFLDELKSFAAKVRTFRRNPSSIDLEEPVRTMKITLDEPDFENAPFDFGCLTMTDDDSVILPVNNYFIVRTPQSTPERWPESEDYSVRSDLITMQETFQPVPHEERVHCCEDFLDGWNFGFPESFLSTAGRKEPEALSEPEIISINSTVIASLDEEIDQGQPLFPPSESEPQWVIRAQEDQNLRAARADHLNVFRNPYISLPSFISLPSLLPFDYDQRRAAKRSSENVVLGPAPSRGRRRRNRRQNLTKDKQISMPVVRRNRNTSIMLLRPLRPPSTPESLVLEPAPARGRSRRKGHLIIDRKIAIPISVLRRNMRISKTLPLSYTLPYIGDTAEAFFSKFGLRTLAKGNRRFWPNLRTLPVPNDPSAFGYFREHCDSS